MTFTLLLFHEAEVYLLHPGLQPHIAVRDWECGALDGELSTGIRFYLEEQLHTHGTAAVAAPSVGQDNSAGSMLMKAQRLLQVATTFRSFLR